MATAISEIMVEAPARQAYRAFTNVFLLRRWLCDVATVDPRPQGRMYLWWNGDFYSSGYYLGLEPEKTVRFRWFSSIDPAATEVTVSLETRNGNTRVSMAHSVPDSADWEQRLVGFKANWDQSLENLKSVLESGIDLRVANRPMLGIVPGDFNPEQAQHLGIPVHEGLRLDGVVEGMGAAAAGLQKDDVIIQLADRKIGSQPGDLRNAIAGKMGGDRVEVVFYRGANKQSIQMEMSRRPMLEVPFNAAELARLGRAKYQSVLRELEKCYENASDLQANTRPARGEWSALETTAHLLHSERQNQAYLAELVDGYERTADGYGGNVEAQIVATTAIYPSIASMLSALRASIAETLALVENLPDEFCQDKSSFYQAGSLILQIDFHYQGHTSQILSTLSTAR